MTPRATFFDPFSGQFLELRVTAHWVAHSRESVQAVLHDLTEMSLRGELWAAGYLTYEAASAFDAAMETHAGRGPFASFLIGDVQPIPQVVGGSDGIVLEQTLRYSEYSRAFDQVLENILAGNIYQANFTMPLVGSAPKDPFALWSAWVGRQESSYAFALDDGYRTILGVSPELFFQVEAGRIHCKPMKGTRPRGRWSEEDEQLKKNLSESEKDRAENLMIVDMVRNDLGRIADVGSVTVSELFSIQKHPTVYQMTSTVEARCAFDLTQIFGALFPCASVTGAPKIMAMQVIRDLEGAPRDVYCGAVGIVAPGARASFNVPIRTGVVRDGVLTYSVGSGLVADSNPEDEWAECLAKAKVVTLSKFVNRHEFHLIETMRSGASGIEHLQQHLDRLERSAEYYGIPFDRSRLRLDAPANKLVRLTLNREGSQTEVRDLPESTEPVRLRVSNGPVNPGNRFLYHKTSFREVYEDAAREAGECDEVVLFNLQGEVTETTISNVAVHRNGKWITPALECGLLPGVMRRVLLEQGSIIEGHVTLEEFRHSKIAVFNAVRGWRSALLLKD